MKCTCSHTCIYNTCSVIESCTCIIYPLLSRRLLSHVFDPDLDKPTPREYIVYACPTGTLDEAIEEFMEAALTHTGRNGAHKSFPHVTLCQFFKVNC